MSTNLSIEQEFTTATTLRTLEHASKEQLLKLYGELLRHHFSQKNYYETLVKHNWGLDELNQRTTEEECGGEESSY